MKSSVRSSLYSRMSRYLTPALVVLFGMHFLRTMIPGLVWYMRDTVGLGTMQLIPYAFGTFFLGFLAAILHKNLGARASFLLTAGGVALLRVIEQFSLDPGLDLWLSIAGLGLFLNFLSIFLGHVRSQGEWAAGRWIFGIVQGLALDIALRGVFGALDLNTIQGPIPSLIIVLLALGLLVLVWREPMPGGGTYSGATFRQALPLLAIGPFFTLQVLFFSSQGYIEQVAELRSPLGFIIVMLGYLLMGVGILWGYAQPRALHPILTLGIAIYLGYAVFAIEQSSSWILLTVLLGQFILGWGFAAITQLNAKAETRGLGQTTWMVGGGMLVFLILVFGYYVGQDMALPFPRQVFPAAAAALSGLFFFIASLQIRRFAMVVQNESAGFIWIGVLSLVPLIYWLAAGPDPVPLEPVGETVDIMSYNIHSGFDSDGRQDLEAIAGVIEASEAEIVALQEVSRVRLMDGGADIPRWLSRRLEMPYVFHGTEEPHWGNAILSRYPILDSGWGDLPRVGKLIGRGYLWARIDTGGTDPLLVIVTHLHHLGPDSEARQAQVPSLLAFWKNQAASIILGDFNAEPDSPEMRMLSEAGLRDAWSLAGEGSGFTFSANEPIKRIDWIWHSEDLQPVEIKVIQTRASDHLPVLARFESLD